MNNILCGTLPSTCGHDEKYFSERDIVVDCRGPLIVHPESRWGFFIKVITKSHDPRDGYLVDRPVVVDANAWICSGAFLYNCHIGEGAIVAVGTVVRSQEVKPYVMVAGNPARVIARFKDNAWQYVSPKWEALE